SEEQEALDTWTVSRLVSLRTRFGPLEAIDEQAERSEKSRDETLDFLLGPALEPGSVPSLIAQTVGAAREVIDVARAEGGGARLTPELLGRLNGTGFRTEGDRESPAPEALAAHLRSVVDHACQWFSAESFAELNPVEQAAIVLLRLLAIRPFA